LPGRDNSNDFGNDFGAELKLRERGSIVILTRQTREPQQLHYEGMHNSRYNISKQSVSAQLVLVLQTTELSVTDILFPE